MVMLKDEEPKKNGHPRVAYTLLSPPHSPQDPSTLINPWPYLNTFLSRIPPLPSIPVQETIMEYTAEYCNLNVQKNNRR